MAVDSGSYDQATLLRRMQIAEAMMKPKKITHWAEGLSNLANTAVGAYDLAKIDAENKQSKYGDSAALAAQLGLPAPSSPSQSTSGAAKIASLLGFDFPGNSSPSTSPAAPDTSTAIPQPASSASPAANPMGNVAAAMSSSPDASLPRGFRNNNPGNIEDGPFARSQPGYIGSDGRFAKFAAMDNGTGAMGALLNSYGKRGLNTVNGIINRWAPSSDGNNVSAYAANVAKQLGIGPDDPIPPAMQPQLIAAMAQHENGRPLPSSQPIASADQPSPLDTAQYPAGPVGAPSTPGGPNAVAAAMGSDPAALPANAQATQGFAIPGQPAKPDVAGALASPPIRGGILANATPQQKAMIAAGLNARPGSAAHTLALSTVQAVMKQQMQQSDPAHQLDMQLKQGQLAAQPMDLALKRKQLEKSDAPGSVQEYEYYKKNFVPTAQQPQPMNYDVWSTAKARAAATTITNNVGDAETSFSKEAGKATAQRFNDLVADGQQARQLMSDMNTLLDLGKGIGTGKAAQAKAVLGPFAEAAGLKVDGLSDIQAYEAIVNRVGPSLRVKGSGAQSDYELKNFLKSIPTLGNTQEGNEMTVAVMNGLQQNKVRASEIASKALAGEITRTEAEKQLRELPDPMQPYRDYKAKRSKVDSLLEKYGGGR